MDKLRASIRFKLIPINTKSRASAPPPANRLESARVPDARLWGDEPIYGTIRYSSLDEALFESEHFGTRMARSGLKLAWIEVYGTPAPSNPLEALLADREVA